MERRSWPWKKKSSEKPVTIIDSSPILPNSGGNQAGQDGNDAINYVQISMESYAHLTELEEQVKILNQKLSAAENELETKDNLVKQHARVAEEAVSGWEKAEAESSALKHQLESVTLLKLTVEERASHLDGALKECMKQIRNVKEESEQKLHDVVLAKTKQWEKAKQELEAKLANFEEELLRASAENAALSRSIQERSTILMKVNDEKVQADTEIELLKSNMQSCEQEIKSLKYELHVISKELEIRNEEKNMSIRSADLANKQHLEDVKKISKLESECQRLRGLVRKRLPGPAAVAQMKLEVENLGRDHGETRLRRSPAKNPGPYHTSIPASDFASESIHTLQKENEFLTASLLTIEEETKMLKEALAKRNSELQASRDLCAKTTSNLCSIEVQLLSLKQQKLSSKTSSDVSDAMVSQNESDPPSLTSMSEDGIDEEGNSSASWATALMSELSQFKKEKVTDKFKTKDNSNHVELMDDFLEMERLAHLSSESNEAITISDNLTENSGATILGGIQFQKDDASAQQRVQEKSGNQPCSDQSFSEGKLVANKLDSLLFKLQSRIASTFKLQGQEVDIGKILDDIRYFMQDTKGELPQHSLSSVVEENSPIEASSDKLTCLSYMDANTHKSAFLKQDGTLSADDKLVFGEEIKSALSEIQEFVMCLNKDATEPHNSASDLQGISEKIQQFCCCITDVMCNEKCLKDFILVLSPILSQARRMGMKMSFDMVDECENNVLDCIDKVTLLENEVAQHEPRNESFSGKSNTLSHSPSHPEIEGPLSDNFVQRITKPKLSLKEFEQMRLEKETMQMELSTSHELLEDLKLRLVATEHNLTEVKSQLAASKKSSSLSETQIKCMAESYGLLELRSQELEAEVNKLRTEVHTLTGELREERLTHQENLAKLRELQDQIKRTEKRPMFADVEIGTKAKQENEIAAAAEKLAECQETILLLGRQLQALRPPAETLASSQRNSISDSCFEDAPGPSGFNAHNMHKVTHSLSEVDMAATFLQTMDGEESPLDFQICTSDTEAGPYPRSIANQSKHQKRRSSRSSSSTSFPNSTPEKNSRGFNWFFSKGKVDR